MLLGIFVDSFYGILILLNLRGLGSWGLQNISQY